MPTMEEFLMLRQNRETMTLFADRFIPCVIGKVSFRRLQQGEPEFDTYTTVSDEGFALLALENIYDSFINIDMQSYFLPRTQGDMKRLSVKGKYTSWGDKAKRFGGWSEAGMDRYNELCGTVSNDRKTNSSTWEDHYREYKRNNGNTSTRGKSAKESVARRVMKTYDDL